MDDIQVHISYKDFYDSDFNSIEDCPLARALLRHFEGVEAHVYYEHAWVDNHIYELVGGFRTKDFMKIKQQYASGNREAQHVTIKLII